MTNIEIENIRVEDENRGHIFWDCKYVQETVQQVHRSVWGIGNVTKRNFLMGRELKTLESTTLYMLVNMYIKYRIWKYKLAGFLPNIICISDDMQNMLRILSRFHKWRQLLPQVRRQLIV